MFSVGLRSLLLADAALMASLPGGIMPILVPEQATYTCMSYQVIRPKPDYTLDGKQYQQPLVQFDIWDPNYLKCQNARIALRNTLDGYQGTLLDGTRVLCCLEENLIDSWQFDGRTYRLTIEYRFVIVEAAT